MGRLFRAYSFAGWLRWDGVNVPLWAMGAIHLLLTFAPRRRRTTPPPPTPPPSYQPRPVCPVNAPAGLFLRVPRVSIAPPFAPVPRLPRNLARACARACRHVQVRACVCRRRCACVRARAGAGAGVRPCACAGVQARVRAGAGGRGCAYIYM
jgi:hypothetical protein